MTNGRKIKFGIIGWRGRGGKVAQDADHVSNGLLVPSVCVEPSEENYENGCEAYGLRPTRYTTIKEMLANDRPDGVLISSPNGFHLENLLELKDSHLPILIEKPLDATFEKICDVVRFAQTYDAPIMVGHCMRYTPILLKAKELLDNGSIGKICGTRFVQNCHYGNAGYHGWRREKEASGTWLLEKATHDFDIMFSLIGDLPKSISAIQQLHGFGGDKPKDLRCSECDERMTCPESWQNILYRLGDMRAKEQTRATDFCAFSEAVTTPDIDQCLFEFDGGIAGTYVQWFFSPRSYHHRVYEIYGTEGAMEINLGGEDGGEILVCPRYGSASDQLVYKFDYVKRTHYNGDGNMCKHFYDVICGNAKPLTTIAQAFAAEVVGYAAICAAEKKQMISVRDVLPDDLKSLYDSRIYQTNVTVKA